MLTICIGNRDDLERAHDQAEQIFRGDSVSPVALAEHGPGFVFSVPTHNRLHLDSFFGWVGQQHQAGICLSCHVVALSVLHDGHVIHYRAV